MCSNSADDADDRLVKETKERKLLAVGAQHPITPPTLPTHNKEDSWPTFETADIHKAGGSGICFKLPLPYTLIYECDSIILTRIPVHTTIHPGQPPRPQDRAQATL